MYARIGSVAAAAALILAGCGGGSHSASGTSSGSGTSSAAPAFDMDHVQTAAARQIETDQSEHLMQGQTRVKCPAPSGEPKAGAKFECNVSSTSNRADTFTGTATIVLNDAAGKTFSLDYKMSNMPLPGQGPKLSLSGTDTSVS